MIQNAILHATPWLLHWLRGAELYLQRASLSCGVYNDSFRIVVRKHNDADTEWAALVGVNVVIADHCILLPRLLNDQVCVACLLML